jgi:hypothetical protein
VLSRALLFLCRLASSRHVRVAVCGMSLEHVNLFSMQEWNLNVLLVDFEYVGCLASALPILFASCIFISSSAHLFAFCLCYIRDVAPLQRHTTQPPLPSLLPPGSRTLCCPQGLPHSILWHLLRDKIVSLQNPASYDPV